MHVMNKLPISHSCLCIKPVESNRVIWDMYILLADHVSRVDGEYQTILNAM